MTNVSIVERVEGAVIWEIMISDRDRQTKTVGKLVSRKKTDNAPVNNKLQGKNQLEQGRKLCRKRWEPTRLVLVARDCLEYIGRVGKARKSRTTGRIQRSSAGEDHGHLNCAMPVICSPPQGIRI